MTIDAIIILTKLRSPVANKFWAIISKIIRNCILIKCQELAQMSDVKLNFFTYISYWSLTKKQSVGIGISYSGFPFYEHCNRQLIHIFYIKTLKVTSSTKR